MKREMQFRVSGDRSWDKGKEGDVDDIVWPGIETAVCLEKVRTSRMIIFEQRKRRIRPKMIMPMCLGNQVPRTGGSG